MAFEKTGNIEAGKTPIGPHWERAISQVDPKYLGAMERVAGCVTDQVASFDRDLTKRAADLVKDRPKS